MSPDDKPLIDSENISCINIKENSSFRLPHSILDTASHIEAAVAH